MPEAMRAKPQRIAPTADASTTEPEKRHLITPADLKSLDGKETTSHAVSPELVVSVDNIQASKPDYDVGMRRKDGKDCNAVGE